MADERRLESGIAYQLIYGYLTDELALCQTEEGEFCYGECFIRLNPLPPRRLGSFCLPRNELLLRGTTQDVERFIDAFTMRFLSAGG